MQKHRLRRVALLAALLAFFTACSALAAETVTFTPYISARETYDSNVNFNRSGDFEHSVTPALRVDVQKERAAGWVQAKAAGFKYSRLNKYDRIDQNYDGAFQANATEKLTVDIKGGIVADHAFSSSLSDTGEITRTASHQVYSVQPSITYALTENNSLSLFYAFSKTVYDTQDYTDSMTNTLGALWGYRMDERLQLLLQLADTRMSTDFATYNNYFLRGGFEYALAETLKARVLAGASTLRTHADTGISRSSNGYSAESALTWQLERMTSTLSFTHDVTLSTNGEDLTRDKLSLYLGYNWTERLQSFFSAGMVTTKSASSEQASQNNRWMEFSPGLKYKLGEKSALTLGYALSSSKNILEDELKTRSRGYLDLALTF